MLSSSARISTPLSQADVDVPAESTRQKIAGGICALPGREDAKGCGSSPGLGRPMSVSVLGHMQSALDLLLQPAARLFQRAAILFRERPTGSGRLGRVHPHPAFFYWRLSWLKA